MKKKKIQLRNLEIKSFVTTTDPASSNTVKAGGFLSIWGASCQYGDCPSDGACTYTCGNTDCTCNCETQFQCPTDDPCNGTDGLDSQCICM